MKQKRGMRKFLDVLNSKPVIGVLIFVMLSLVSVWAGNVIVKEGSLNVENNLDSSGVLYVNGTSGRVGIGTTSPGTKLEVAGEIRAKSSGNAAKLSLQDTGAANSQVWEWQAYESGLGSGLTLNSLKSTGNVVNIIYATPAGNVGIGTTSPNQKLEVKGNLNMSDGANQANIYFTRSAYDTYALGDIGSGFVVFDVTDNRYDMVFDGTGKVGIGTESPGNKLEVSGGNIKIATAMTKLIFDSDLRYIQGYRSGADYLTIAEHSYASGIQLGFADATNPGASYPFYPTMTITSASGAAGKVGIGTTTPTNALQVIGNINASGTIYADDFIMGSLLADWGGFSSTAWTNTLCGDGSGYSSIQYCTSTRRNKANEQLLNPSDSIIPFLMQLQPKTYNIKEFETGNILNETHIGLIAEDVYDIAKGTDYENLIQFEINETTGEKWVRGIDYQFGLVTLLIKGMQEQQKKIEELETKLSKICENSPELCK